MVPGTESVNPVLMPISARTGNQLQNLGDGMYIGQNLNADAYYVNNTTGVDDGSHGTRAAPFRTLDFALAQLTAQSPNGQFRGLSTIALQAGQTFTMNADFNIFAGSLTITFYGDPQYGDFNSPVVGSGAQPAWMSDLQRPIIVPSVTAVASQWYMFGINRAGGNVSVRGVKVNLPPAPATPTIGLYSQFADFVRSQNLSDPGYVSLVGSIINMTDTNAFFGFLGIPARALSTSFAQFASQFQVNGILLNAANSPTAAQLLARQYFIKMYADLPGNSSTGVLSPTSQNSSGGSGIVNLSWSDTEVLTVATGKTNLGTFPPNFDINFGIRNYIFGLQKDQQSRPTNVISPRLI